MHNSILNRFAAFWKFNNQKQINSWHFLFGQFRFWTNLIKFSFLIFLDTAGRVGKFFLGQVEAEKLTGSGGKSSETKKKNVIYPSTSHFFRE